MWGLCIRNLTDVFMVTHGYQPELGGGRQGEGDPYGEISPTPGKYVR